MRYNRKEIETQQLKKWEIYTNKITSSEDGGAFLRQMIDIEIQGKVQSLNEDYRDHKDFQNIFMPPACCAQGVLLSLPFVPLHNEVKLILFCMFSWGISVVLELYIERILYFHRLQRSLRMYEEYPPLSNEDILRAYIFLQSDHYYT